MCHFEVVKYTQTVTISYPIKRIKLKNRKTQAPNWSALSNCKARTHSAVQTCYSWGHVLSHTYNTKACSRRMEVKANLPMCGPITLCINSLWNLQLTCLVHVPLKFLCGLALPFVVLSIVWQPVMKQGMVQVSLASFAKATVLSTMRNQKQDVSINGSGFGVLWHCFGFWFPWFIWVLNIQHFNSQ